jgi:thiosulfate dehydrogenase
MRPIKVFKEDWPNIAGKPFDHPYGPYADTFTEQQHKYGPFGPIKKYKEDQKKESPVLK